MMVFAWIVFFFAVMMVLAFQRSSLSVWTIGIGVFLLLCSYFSKFHPAALIIFWLIFAVVFIPLNFLPLRRRLLSRAIFNIYRKVMRIYPKQKKKH